MEKQEINNMENKQAPMGQYHIPFEKANQEIYPIDATKAVTIQELGIIFNALGVGMTKEFAETHKLEHLLMEQREGDVWQEEK